MKSKMDENVSIVENAIQTGHKNALSRKYLSKKTGLSDRMVRRAIELSSKPIINCGHGYYIPDLRDEKDASELSLYCSQERNRIRTMAEKMENKFSGLEIPPEYEQLSFDFVQS